MFCCHLRSRCHPHQINPRAPFQAFSECLLLQSSNQGDDCRLHCVVCKKQLPCKAGCRLLLHPSNMAGKMIPKYHPQHFQSVCYITTLHSPLSGMSKGTCQLLDCRGHETPRNVTQWQEEKKEPRNPPQVCDALSPASKDRGKGLGPGLNTNRIPKQKPQLRRESNSRPGMQFITICRMASQKSTAAAVLVTH